MICPACRRENENGARFCAVCGARMDGAGLPGSAGGQAPAQAPSTGAAQAARKPATSDYDNVDPTAPGHEPGEIDLIGKVIHNRYRIKDRLGEGGFGAVYRAEHQQMGRVCALKVLHPRMAREPQVVARFRREAQAASVLKDSHTVQIYDFDQDEAGIFYLAMELVEGRSLHSEISRGPIPMLRVAHILDGAAQSLGEAHQHGIVHRDIKPENILLAERQNDRDYVKVLDFGIAKIARGSNLQGGPALTAAGQTLGTVEYMSPEQLMGQELDGRSDLYALGVLSYEMLTGSLPFNTRTPAEMISAHLKTVPTPPSQHSPGLGISPEMDRIVLKLLEKKRDQRYPSTAELQNDLRRVLGLPALHMPSSAPTSPVTQTVAQLPPPPTAARKNAPLLIAVVAVAVLGALALGYWLLGSKAHATPATPVARLLPSGMPGLIVIDVPQLRATAPPAVVQMMLDATRPQLKEIGADPDKLGQVAAGFVPPHNGSEAPGGILVADLPVDAQLLEKQLQGPMRSVPYKDVTIRRGKVDSYAVLPGDRLVMGLRHDLTRAIELSSGPGKGQASSLVDGPAAALLGRVGASGGRGPALFGWLHMSDQQRADLSRAMPALSKFDEMAGSLAIGAANGAGASGGVDARMIGRCASEADAQSAAAALRATLEEVGRNPMVALLGLRPLLDNLRIAEEGAMVNASLHLSAAQYADLITRLGGVASTMAQELSLGSPGGPGASLRPKSKAKPNGNAKPSASH
ncbi:MAG TPA: serine/threonine-protein kinase [Polyangia bacterium]|jgi:serine/threonine-protein kinase|nr:serine/threonine-protein kinase [Polyangia bacterium]